MFVILLILLTSLAATAGEPQLLCFGASWCQPCQKMKPALEQLHRDGYPLVRIDVDQHRELAKKYEVSAVPSFVLVDRTGRAVDRIDSATSYETLTRFFAHYAIRPRAATIRGQNQVAVPDARSMQPGLSRTESAVASVPAVRVPATSLPLASPPNRLSAAGNRATTPASVHRSPQGLAMASTVRLKVEDEGGHSYGTGTVIDVHGQEALVLTCGHIFRPSGGKGQILMDRFDSPTAEPTTGSLISYDMDSDIGLVSMKLSRPIQVSKLAPLGYRPTPGDPIFSVGCSRGESPTVMDGKVNQVDKYLGPSNITASSRPVDGRSGGGLFNRAGELIGVCSAADPELDEGLYGALPRVYHELDRNGLSFVYEDSQEADAGPIAQVASTSHDLPGLAGRPVQAVASSATPSSHLAVSNSLARGIPVPAVPQPAASNDELVCVLRGGSNNSKAFVIKNPSKTLLEYLEREAEQGE